LNARYIALKALLRVEKSGAYSNLVLQGLCNRAAERDEVKPEDNRLAMELLYGVLRRRMFLDAWIEDLAKRPISKIDPPVLQVLRLALYQLVFLDRIPQHAALAESGKLLRLIERKHAVGFVNAVLRNWQRRWRAEKFDPRLPKDALERISVSYSIPKFIVDLWRKEAIERGLSEERKILADLRIRAEAANKIPPLVLCPNPVKIESAELTQELKDHQAAPRKGYYAEGSLLLPGSDLAKVALLMEDGLCHAMDQSAQLVGLMLEAEPGMRVLDTCSAPGGKSLQIAGLMQGQGKLIALDLHESRLELLRYQAKLHGFDSIETLTADASLDIEGLEHESFDRVLVDAPCSALGIIRRHPEIRYRRKAADIAERARVAKAILDNAWKYVKPGGSLVFAVCTYTREEGIEQLQHFAETHKQAKIVASKAVHDGLWKDTDGLPYMDTSGVPDLDGFFAFKAVKS